MNSQDDTLLEAEGLSKSFGDVRVCDHIDMVIKRGEIHALLGDNGAGKSTFIKMLFGSLLIDEGTVSWKNKPVGALTPRIARNMGIDIVYQNLSLFNALTSAENIALSLGANVPISSIIEKATELARTYNMSFNPHALAGELSIGERQRVAIIRCLMTDPELIILDEPTAVLTPNEIEDLMEVLRSLRAAGKSVLYITHHLQEVFDLCDRATILRDGKVVDTVLPENEDISSLIRKMVGKDVPPLVKRPSKDGPGDILLDIRNLSRVAEKFDDIALKNITLSLRKREIVGIAGVAGSGQKELFEALSGEVYKDASHSIMVSGDYVGHLGIAERRRIGIAFVPEERVGQSIALQMSLSENLLLSRHTSDKELFLGPFGIVYYDKIKVVMRRIVDLLTVRKAPGDPLARSLSGGNLQKFVMGRELDRNPLILVVNQPTWGVDAVSSASIRQALIDLAHAGSTVLVISQDLDELFEVCDLIGVMHEGELSELISVSGTTRENITSLMGKGRQAKYDADLAENEVNYGSAG